MIGTISIECNAKNPNMPLHPLRAYINSPSSLRIMNVPRKIGKWNINKVTIVAIYPDSTQQTAECILTGGVWVGTIEGSTTAGTLAQGYSILADGVDENGNDVTGYVLGKGDVEIMQSSSTPEPEPSTTFVRLQDDGTGAKDGVMYPTESGYMIQQNGEAHLLGTPFDQITAYVDSQISSKAEISSVPTKTSDLSNDAGFITSTEVYALYSSPLTDTKINVDSNGDLVEKKTIDQIGVWYVKGVYDGSIQIFDYWTSIPTLNGMILSGLIQDRAGKYLPAQWSTEVSEITIEKIFDFVYYDRTIRISIKKSEAYQIPFEIETGRISLAYNYYPILSVSQLSNDAGYLTEHQSLSDYYTKSQTSSSVELYTKFETKADLSAIPTKTSELSNDSGFITEATYIEDANENRINADRSVFQILSGEYQLADIPQSDQIWHVVGTYQNQPIDTILSNSNDYSWSDGSNTLQYLEYYPNDFVWLWNNIDSANETSKWNAALTFNYTGTEMSAIRYSRTKLATEGFVATYTNDSIFKAMPYNEISSAHQYQNVVYLEDRAIQHVALSNANTVLQLPNIIYDEKTCDFIVDVTNNCLSNGTAISAQFSLAGLIGTDFNILVPKGQDFSEMTTMEANEIAEFYFTKTSFQLSGITTWKVAKQTVENYTIQTI